MSDEHDHETDGGARGGAWLTYAYRFGSAAGAHASGTIKAPSFGVAARRLVAERLAGQVGPEPAFLRLRAAGQEEVLLEVSRSTGDPGARPTLVVVPSDRFRFERAEAPERDAR